MTARGRSLSAVVLLALLASLPLLAAEEATPIAPGATHRVRHDPAGPWVIHIVEAQLGADSLEADALLGGGEALGRRALSAMLAAAPATSRVAVAAVNGDFFATTGGSTTIPLGLHISGGELVTFPHPTRSALYLLEDGRAGIATFSARAWLSGPERFLYPISAMNRQPERGELVLFTPRFGAQTRAADALPHYVLEELSGRVRPGVAVKGRIAAIANAAQAPIPPRGAVLVANGVAAYGLRRLQVGDEVQLKVDLSPEVGEIRAAVGGGPRLVWGGRLAVEHRQERFADSFAHRRHPRSGVGLREGTLVLVTVDGRQPGYSEGMTLTEFGQLFLDLGCTEAMNLDGGGSTTMVVRGRVVNSPSDGGERRVANGLGLFSRALPTGEPVRLAVEPAEATILAGETLALTVQGLDRFYNPVPVDLRQVRWEAGGLGLVDAQGRFLPAAVSAPTAGLVTARWGQLSAAAVICVVPSPARLVISPERATVPAGGTQRFVVRAYDENAHPVQLSPRRVQWSCEPAEMGGKVSADGVFTAPSRSCEMRVVARIGQVAAGARVLVGVVTRVIQDFEQPREWRFAAEPPRAPGRVGLVPDPLRKGNRCLELRYDFGGSGGTRAAHALLDLPLPETRTISLETLGDGQGCWLRARVRDAADRRFLLDLAPKVDWKGEWRQITAWLPDEAVAPVVLETIYITEYHADRRPAGTIYLDNIGAEPGR